MILALILVITGSAVTASAAEFDNSSGWFDLFDYNPSFSRDFGLTDVGVSWFDIPVTNSRLYAIDMLIMSNNTSELGIWVGNAKKDPVLLQRVQISSNLYRYYGNIYMTGYDQICMAFTADGYYAGQIVSCMVSYSKRASNADIGSMRIQYANTSVDVDETLTMSSVSDSLLYADSLSYSSEYSLQLYSTEWRKYDYIDFVFASNGISYDSITGVFNGTGLNIDYEYIDSPGDGYIYTVIRMDLRGVRKTDGGTPVIKISGMAWDTFAVQLTQVTGHVLVSDIDPYVYWFNSIRNGISSLHSGMEGWFSSLGNSIGGWFGQLEGWLADGFKSVTDKLDQLINGSSDQQEAADQFKENASQQSGQIDSAIDSMQVARPDSADMDTSVEGVTGGLDFSPFNAALLTISSTGTVYRLLFIAVTLMLVSYVFFGKKV